MIKTSNDIKIVYICNETAGLCIVLTKSTATQNDVVLSYCRVRGLYFLAVAFAVTIVYPGQMLPSLS